MTSSELAACFPLGLGVGGIRTSAPAGARSMLRAIDGSVVWWGDVDTPAPAAAVPRWGAVSITVAVYPVRPGHAVTVEYRVNGGALRQAVALPELRARVANARLFRAVVPGQPDGLVEFLPVLHFAGRSISPRLGETAECPRYQVGRTAAPVVTAGSSMPASDEGSMLSSDIQTRDLPLQRHLLSDGTECRLPIRYFDARVLIATFLADSNRAAALLEGTGLKTVRQEDGKAIVLLGCFEYRKTDLGPYNEVGLVILAKAPGDSIPAHYVVNLPVTTALSMRAGQEIWGFNKFVAAIDLKSERNAFSTTIHDPENATIGTLEGRRGASAPVPPSDLLTFSLRKGKVIKTVVQMLTPFQAGSGDGFVFKVGTSRHPMASSLRTLALDGARPVMVRYADPFQALLFPGRGPVNGT